MMATRPEVLVSASENARPLRSVMRRGWILRGAEVRGNRLRRALVVTGGPWIDADRQNAVRFKTQVDVLGTGQAVDEKPGCHQKNQRSSHSSHYQRGMAGFGAARVSEQMEKKDESVAELGWSRVEQDRWMCRRWG